MHTIVSEAYETAQQILLQNRAVLDDMANALIEYETLDGEQLEELIRRVKPLALDLSKTGGTTPNGRSSDRSAQPDAPQMGLGGPNPLPA